MEFVARDSGFDELKLHLGHNIECVKYTGKSKNTSIDFIVLECIDCNYTLLQTGKVIEK